MTKPLSKEEKKKRKDERKAARMQKAASTTSTQVHVDPKAEAAAQDNAPTEEPANLCDTCAFTFGECEGTPSFASDQEEGLTGADADRVVKCPAWQNVDEFPTADQDKKEPTDQDQGEPDDAAHDGDDEGQNEPGGDQGEDPELVHENVAEGATEEGKAEDLATMRADLPVRPDPKRFAADETDYGNCPSCTRPLKRTAYNRYVDAIRCVNPRCRAYRAVVKTVSTGVK